MPRVDEAVSGEKAQDQARRSVLQYEEQALRAAGRGDMATARLMHRRALAAKRFEEKLKKPAPPRAGADARG